MPRLAIVISAVGSIESLEGTLVSVLENRPSDCEIVVALRQPYADPYDLKEEVRFIAPARRASAIVAINEALAAVRAPFVHLLASGCTVREGWTEAPLARFGDRRLAAVVPWVLESGQTDRLFAVGVGYRTRGKRFLVGRGLRASDFEVPSSVIGPALFAAFYRKAALDALGGLCRQLGPRQADADLALMLRQAGLTTAVESRSQIFATAAADPRVGDLAEALAEERMYWRNQKGGLKLRSVVSHLGLASWDVIRSLPHPRAMVRLSGRLVAALELGAHHRHRRLLAELAVRAVPAQAAQENVRIDSSHASPARPEATQVRSSVR